MKMVINFLRQRSADSAYGFEIRQPRFTDRPAGSEMMQQGAFSQPANAGDVIELGSRNSLAASGAMAADGKPVGLVAKPLKVIENRVIGRHHKGPASVDMKTFASGIPVRPLGNPDDRYIVHRKIREDFRHRAQLAFPAIDQQ